jgi:tetratricopeptide (TPR) repeat protein
MASLANEAGGEGVAGAPVASTVPLDEQCKQEGNVAFANGEYQKAVDLYSKGLAENDQNFKLYSNRSGAYFKMENFESALADANAAISISPTWLKPYHRKGSALSSLKRYAEAIEAYEKAVQIDPKAEDYKRRLKAARLQLKAARNTRSTIRNLPEWLAIHGAEADIRMRLGIMAEFWNLSKKNERLMIFNCFLGLIGGATKGAPSMPKFTKKDMSSLPMKNYEDLTFPEEWTKYFKNLDPEAKVNHFRAMFSRANEYEKTLIINDLKHFFAAPVPT